ncbi:tensin-4-like [Alosa sapidissima]|uniref:tensin-4-like n=1 Tax=Alosa sapidissima TaxID=34773 RepID=UPI001C09ACAB|nr:tensin-4-like [Alosa sapidissima]
MRARVGLIHKKRVQPQLDSSVSGIQPDQAHRENLQEENKIHIRLPVLNRVMPMATDMSQFLPNHTLKATQSLSLDQAEEDLDISLDNLNQMILELDPTFEPLPISRHSPGRNKHTVSSPEDSPEEEDMGPCMLVSRGCSSTVEVDYATSTSSRARVSPCTPTVSVGATRIVAIPQLAGSVSPHGSVVFSDSPSSSSSRPPLPCGIMGGGMMGGVQRRRPQPPSQQTEVAGSPGNLSLFRNSLRGSANSLLSTSPGSDTSYIMGSCQSLLSDDTDSSPEGLTPSLSGSLGDVSRAHRPYGCRQLHGVPLSPYLNSSPSGSLTDIPVVLINGAPQSGTPEGHIRDHHHGLSVRSTSRSPSPQETPTSMDRRPFQGSQPNMKFVMDTSQYWFRPQITREEADAILRVQDPGSFVVRDSTSYRGCFDLAMKIHPAATDPVSLCKPDDSTDQIKHFLIESSAKGVRVRGSSHEPYFGSLSALVYQHTISPYALPCRLVIHSQGVKRDEEGSPTTSPSEEPSKTACNFLYLCAVPTETLTGPCAVQKAVSMVFKKEAAATPTVVNLKVSPKGVTLTDIQRKLFFRRHFPVHLLSYGGEDPEERRWQKSCKSVRMFGIVAKGVEAGAENMCHVFAEYDPLQPCGLSLQLIHNMITSSHA